MKPLCPCGKPLLFADCCGRLLAGEPAADAEALMRSRYTAYALEAEPYLLATWHPSTRPSTLGLAEEPRLKWLGLAIKRHRQADATHAEVEYVARYKIAGRAHRLHERSRFVLEDGRWYYLDGDLVAPAKE